MIAASISSPQFCQSPSISWHLRAQIFTRHKTRHFTWQFLNLVPDTIKSELNCNETTFVARQERKHTNTQQTQR